MTSSRMKKRQNECGLLNPICCDDPFSAWCDTESGEEHNRSYNWMSETMKRQQMRNLFAAMMFSHGTPMILGGDEWMRTQYGNNNAYSTWADNEWNWFRWGEWQSTTRNFRSRMHDFVRQSIQMRKDREYAFAPTEYGGGMPFDWKSPSNGNDRLECSSVHDSLLRRWQLGTRKEIAILVNMETFSTDYTLPQGRSWTRIMDTQSYYDMDGTNGESQGYFNAAEDANPRVSENIWLEGDGTMGSTYTVQPFSIVILEEQ